MTADLIARLDPNSYAEYIPPAVRDAMQDAAAALAYKKADSVADEAAANVMPHATNDLIARLREAQEAYFKCYDPISGDLDAAGFRDVGFNYGAAFGKAADELERLRGMLTAPPAQMSTPWGLLPINSATLRHAIDCYNELTPTAGDREAARFYLDDVAPGCATLLRKYVLGGEE